MNQRKVEHILNPPHWDKNRGLNADSFGDAMDRAKGSGQEMDELYVKKSHHKDGVPAEDPYGHLLKPKGVPTWSRPPATPEEEAMYYGVHIHSESNPLGLHSHIPGGSPGGAHSHGPQNRYGSHHHKASPGDMVQVDGDHEHCGKNYPDGKHEHCPENFG